MMAIISVIELMVYGMEFAEGSTLLSSPVPIPQLLPLLTQFRILSTQARTFYTSIPYPSISLHLQNRHYPQYPPYRVDLFTLQLHKHHLCTRNILQQLAMISTSLPRMHTAPPFHFHRADTSHQT
jgi:hypothetical protein